MNIIKINNICMNILISNLERLKKIYKSYVELTIDTIINYIYKKIISEPEKMTTICSFINNQTDDNDSKMSFFFDKLQDNQNEIEEYIKENNVDEDYFTK
jgi:hypothetical protein